MTYHTQYIIKFFVDFINLNKNVHVIEIENKKEAIIEE